MNVMQFANQILAESMRAACIATNPHVEGPYYRPGAPSLTDIFPSGSTGKPLYFSGLVVDEECNPIPGCAIEIWQADDSGHYDNDDPDHPPDPDFFRCRCRMATDSSGAFIVRTVLPGNYAVDPAGDWIRVKHLHFKLYAPGKSFLTTEIALLPDQYAERDPLFDSALATEIAPIEEPSGSAWRALFRFTLFKPFKTQYARSIFSGSQFKGGTDE
jgi:catechol 1,2-dioxygenase